MKIGLYFEIMKRTPCCPIWQLVSIHLFSEFSTCPDNFYVFLGLAAILFAISIDKPELNDLSSQQKHPCGLLKSEPVIEAPLQGR